MKTSIMVLGIGCAATMAIVLSTDNGIPGANLFHLGGVSVTENETESDDGEQTDELLTPLPDHAGGLTKVLHRLHATSVRAFESVPFPYFGKWRTPTMTLLDEPVPPKHIPLVAFNENQSRFDGVTRTEAGPNEAWLWAQLMYGVTDRGFVYRSHDLRPDTVRRSRQNLPYQTPPHDWREIADSALTDKERKATNKMVVGFPLPSGIDISNQKTPEYNVRLVSPKPKTNKDRVWRIRQFQLVSLLKHDPPVAYLDQGPPKKLAMDQAPFKLVGDDPEKIPTRSLNETEVASLEALSEGKDHVLAWDTAEERLQLIGAIRAKDSCLKCHEVKRGDLLGAFTYWIEEERKAPDEAAAQDETKRPR